MNRNDRNNGGNEEGEEREEWKEAWPRSLACRTCSSCCSLPSTSRHSCAMESRIGAGTARNGDDGEEDIFVMPSRTFYCAAHPKHRGESLVTMQIRFLLLVPMDVMDHFVTIRIVCRWQPILMDEKRGRTIQNYSTFLDAWVEVCTCRSILLNGRDRTPKPA